MHSLQSTVQFNNSIMLQGRECAKPKGDCVHGGKGYRIGERYLFLKCSCLARVARVTCVAHVTCVSSVAYVVRAARMTSGT